MKEQHRPRFFVFVLCTLPLALAAYAADVGGLMRQGNSLYSRGKYDEALARYQMAEVLEHALDGKKAKKASREVAA